MRSMKLNLCNKHRAQFNRYGQIIDSTKETTNDKNKYIIHDNYAEIIICDKKQQTKTIAVIDLEDVERCKTVKWTSNGQGYIEGNQKRYKLHRFIMNYDGPLQVDHINRNKLDNRKENLRIVSIFINNQNNGANGVSFDKKTNKWKAEANRYGKYYYIGSYKKKEEAIEARKHFVEAIEKDKDKLLNEFINKDNKHSIGVRPSPHGKWLAKFCAEGKTFHVGTFNTKEEAIKEREKAIEKYKNKKASA